MADFFKRLYELRSDSLLDWAKIIDWIFDDEKFDPQKGWTPGYVGVFTKEIHKIDGFRIKQNSRQNYYYEKLSELSFPKKHPKSIRILMKAGSGEGKDLIRHIRNGIAHGKTKFYTVSGVTYVEIIDFSKVEDGGAQTAYIFIPLDHIQLIQHAYQIAADTKNRKKEVKTRRATRGK